MKSIEIHTSQHVPIEYELASLKLRGVAFFLDLLIYFIPYHIVLILLIDFIQSYLGNWGVRAYLILTLLGFIVYVWLAELFGGGQTLGKRLMKLRVMRLDGRPPQPTDFLMRAIFLTVEFFLSMGALAAVLIGSTAHAQRLGDLAAGTVVVNLKPSLRFSLDTLLNIVTIENYQPRFPQVKQLSDSDVLLLKQLLGRYRRWPNEANEQAMMLARDLLCERLQIAVPQKTEDVQEFLNTLIRDYIVLTR